MIYGQDSFAESLSSAVLSNIAHVKKRPRYIKEEYSGINLRPCWQVQFVANNTADLNKVKQLLNFVSKKEKLSIIGNSHFICQR
jgi:hypothetical protein